VNATIKTASKLSAVHQLTYSKNEVIQ